MRARRLTAMAFLVCLAVACADEPTSFHPAPLDYRDRRPLTFAVERVTIVSEYRAPGTAPFVGHTIQPPPEAATRALLEQRLQAGGGTGELQAAIVDASVIAIDLETDDGLSGYLTTEADTRLEGRLKVRVDYLDAAGEMRNSATTAVTRTRTIAEDVGYADRQRAGHELVRALVDDLDSGLVSNIQESFGDVLVE